MSVLESVKMTLSHLVAGARSILGGCRQRCFDRFRTFVSAKFGLQGAYHYANKIFRMVASNTEGFLL